jgi:sugar/nucleoside kinase (ribokinase family)
MIQHDPTSRTEVLVTGHICLDVITNLVDPTPLRPGHIVTARPVQLSTGGTVANVGVALRRLGTPVSLLARVGDDVFGGIVLDTLRAAGPELAKRMLVTPGAATSYSIVINPPGVDRTFLHCAGANDDYAAADVPATALAAARIMHLGYPPLLRRLYADGGAELARVFEQAQSAGVVTSLDLCDVDPEGPAARVDWQDVLARALPHVDIFAPSVGELNGMLRVTPQDAGSPPGVGAPVGDDAPVGDNLSVGDDAPVGDDVPVDDDAPVDLALVRNLAERALALGARVVAIKLGDQGLYLRTAAHDLTRLGTLLGLDPALWRDREVLAPCFTPTQLTGTTGSGDATIAGLLAALMRGADPITAATAATAVGACSVEAADATSGIPVWSEVAARVDAGWARLPVGDALTAGRRWQHDPQGTLFDPDPQEAA